MHTNAYVEDLKNRLQTAENSISDQDDRIKDQNCLLQRQADKLVEQETLIKSQANKIQEISQGALNALHEASDAAAFAIRHLCQEHTSDINQLKAAADCAIQEARTQATWECFRYVADLLADRVQGCDVH